MWKFNRFTTPREPTSLEGRYVDVGNIKVYVRNVIAEGGFSCVYLARDALTTSKQYALKHIICNDGESLELVVKEVSVMKTLKGHPNVVTLVAHTILDMGRTKEALLLMEFCDKSLVTALEKRGASYFEETQILLIFRDVCNAVFALHCQSPPIAHRDVKAENILLGSDGAWKLCDFGSTSTKHKCFDRPEEMGIEEDNIRKHTTPAYRAPEMWDLYRKEVISEKVDIWALGCLLYRICYLKSAFDGESKLQILNGNYRIPEVPKYTPFMTQLIKDMLEASPVARPDITQVLFRVNQQLPMELQKHLSDVPATAVNLHPHTAKSHIEGVSNKANLMHQRNPPLTSTREVQSISPQSQCTPKTGRMGGSLMGAFWSSHHAQDKDVASLSSKETRKDSHKMSDGNHSQTPQLVNKTTSQNESINTFVADFDTSRLNVGNANNSRSEQETDVNNLKEQLKQANKEKAEITSKYEKLSAICRSQRQEIQELKRALATGTSSPQPNKDISKSQSSPCSLQISTPQQEKMDGGILELQQAMFANNSLSACPSPRTWQSFPDEPKSQPASNSNQPGLMWPTNGPQNVAKPAASITNNSWAFGQDNTLLSPGPSSQIPKSANHGHSYHRFGSSDAVVAGTNQPPRDGLVFEESLEATTQKTVKDVWHLYNLYVFIFQPDSFFLRLEGTWTVAGFLLHCSEFNQGVSW